MGGEQSTESDKSGWRVLQVMKNSPCGDKGLITYFHVLTHVNGVRVTQAESSLFSLIQHGQLTKLSFVNFATGGRLEMDVVPNKNWGGDGLLGLVIRHQDMENADLDTVHILDVYPGSPAAAAGLIPYRDYLLGTSEKAFRGWDELDWFLEKYDNTPAQMFVFNSSTFQVREVTITPSKSWGGKGSLGCDVGIGYLHRLPLDQGKEAQSAAAGVRSEPLSASNSSRSTVDGNLSGASTMPFTNFTPSLPPRPQADLPSTNFAPSLSSFQTPPSDITQGPQTSYNTPATDHSQIMPSAHTQNPASTGYAQDLSVHLPPGFPSSAPLSSLPSTTFSHSAASSFPQNAYGAFPQSTFPQSTFPQSTFPQSTFPQSTFPQSTFPQSTFPQSTFPGVPTHPGPNSHSQPGVISSQVSPS